jgi:glutathione synthase/RimK-type ligase-like ATP-grasp enzyme
MNYLIRRRKLGRTSARMIAQKSQTGIQAFRNDQNPPPGEIVFRWGCTSILPGNPTVIQKAAAIHAVGDKLEFRRLLDQHELSPKTYFTREEVRFPAIVRPRYHHQGRNLYVVNDAAELETAIAKALNHRVKWQHGNEGWYGSEIIQKMAEYRVGVVSGRAVWVARKTPGNPQDIAWNVYQGGRFDNVAWDAWPLKAVKDSIAAFNLTELDFGGVDVMVDAEDESYILEINAAPSLTSDYRQTGFAKAFDYIVRNGSKRLPLVEEKGGYKKFIHPAVCAEARMVQEAPRNA